MDIDVAILAGGVGFDEHQIFERNLDASHEFEAQLVAGGGHFHVTFRGVVIR